MSSFTSIKSIIIYFCLSTEVLRHCWKCILYKCVVQGRKLVVVYAQNAAICYLRYISCYKICCITVKSIAQRMTTSTANLGRCMAAGAAAAIANETAKFDNEDMARLLRDGRI